MKRRIIPLAHILGIPIEIDYSWFLIFVLLTWMLAISYYPSQYEDWPLLQYWLLGALTSVLLFACVLLHEVGHSVLALRYKIPVRRITLFVFGGVAQIGAEPPSPVAEFWIALAGPAVSLALAGVFFLMQFVFAGIAPLFALSWYLAYINGTLALFNLIPGFPLDGGRILRAFLWGFTHNLRRATHIAASVGRGIAFLFIVFGVWLAIAGNIAAGLWVIFIGWFLESAASGQIRQHMTQDLLAGHHVSDAMSGSYTAISTGTALQPLVDCHVLGKGQRTFLVKEGDEVVGLLTLHQIKGVPRAEWPQTTAAQVMLPATEMRSVQPDTELWAVLQEMDRNGVNQLPVKSDSQIVGMLTRDGIISFLRTLRELEA